MNKTAQKRAEAIWLHFFNETVFQAGLITQQERDLLCLRIQTQQAKYPKYLWKETSSTSDSE